MGNRFNYLPCGNYVWCLVICGDKGKMKLYHYTRNSNLKNIFEDGLKPNAMGIVYLCPTLDVASAVIASSEYENIIEVETDNLKLTAFDDCKEWEVLCWTDKPIPVKQLTLLQFH